MDENILILLVDDDEDDHLFFKEALEKVGIFYTLTIARDSFQFFNMLEAEKKFDIIFLDINMPKMDGKECLKKIKTIEAYKNIPVIMFTSSQSSKDIDETFNTGAHFYLVKPYAQINFIAALKVIFSVNWKSTQPLPARNDFVINYAFVKS
jgi:CheY-like chemotaxis protein